MGERTDHDRTDRPWTAQPPPRGGRVPVHVVAAVNARERGHRALEDLLIERGEFGTRKYGTPLLTHNGRDPVRDAAEEAVDLVAYLQQAALEGRPVGHLQEPASALADRLARLAAEPP